MVVVVVVVVKVQEYRKESEGPGRPKAPAPPPPENHEQSRKLEGAERLDGSEEPEGPEGIERHGDGPEEPEPSNLKEAGQDPCHQDSSGHCIGCIAGQSGMVARAGGCFQLRILWRGSAMCR